MMLTSEVLCSLFPSLDRGLVTEVVDGIEAVEEGRDVAALRHLVLMSTDHWLEALADRCHRQPPVMVVLRGLPGSGKSTLAAAVVACCGGPEKAVKVSADDFFHDRDGRYTFVPSLIDTAHEWSQAKARKAMKAEKSPVVVDNTNLQVISKDLFLLGT